MADEDSIETKVLGIPLKAKGINAVALVIMALATGGSMFLLWDRTQQSDEHLDAISLQHTKARDEQTAIFNRDHLAIVEAVKGVQSVNEKIGELIEEQNYIVLSNDADRKAMKEKLRRPPSLSRKLDR
jgi:hypothetical protein